MLMNTYVLQMFITLYFIIFKKTPQINSATVKESQDLREITSVSCYFYACPGILQSGRVRIGVEWSGVEERKQVESHCNLGPE